MSAPSVTCKLHLVWMPLNEQTQCHSEYIGAHRAAVNSSLRTRQN